jgi:hypothetical protein
MLSLIFAIVAGAIGLGLAIILKLISGLAESSRLAPLPIRALPQRPTRLRHFSCRGDLP